VDLINSPFNADLNGDGTEDIINLDVMDNDGDYRGFVLKINNSEISGEHSYNVAGFVLIDIDKSDKQKEIGVYTPNANGPDEYIIYKYDGTSIKQIGRTYSATTFNGDGTVDVITFMPFWDKNDRYIYNRDKDELEWVKKKEYDIDVECAVVENFTVFPSIGSRGTSGILKIGQKIRIKKAIVVDNCNKTGPYSWALCDEFYYIANDGRDGWATMEDMMGKIDLPLLP
jgi:hypothetical protein